MASTSSWGGGTIYIDNGSTLSNSSGTFTATTNDSISRFMSGNGTAAFSNAGTFVKAPPPEPPRSVPGVSFNNSGISRCAIRHPECSGGRNQYRLRAGRLRIGHFQSRCRDHDLQQRRQHYGNGNVPRHRRHAHRDRGDRGDDLDLLGGNASRSRHDHGHRSQLVFRQQHHYCGDDSGQRRGVRREKVWFFSGCKSHPASLVVFQPVAIQAAVEATKPSEPWVERVRYADSARERAVTRVNAEQAPKTG